MLLRASCCMRCSWACFSCAMDAGSCGKASHHACSAGIITGACEIARVLHPSANWLSAACTWGKQTSGACRGLPHPCTPATGLQHAGRQPCCRSLTSSLASWPSRLLVRCFRMDWLTVPPASASDALEPAGAPCHASRKVMAADGSCCWRGLPLRSTTSSPASLRPARAAGHQPQSWCAASPILSFFWRQAGLVVRSCCCTVHSLG